MKLADLRAIPWRVKILVTRKTVWVDGDGKEETQKETWSSAWAIVGVHSWQWWWVRRWGEMPCGCTRNPLTRRMVLFDLKCPTHMSWWDEDGGYE